MSSKSNTTYTKLPPETQITIKKKYLEGYTSSEIANEFKLSRQALDWIIKTRGWSEERSLMRAELFQKFSETKKAAFTGIYMDGTTLLRKAVKDALKEYEEGNMSIKDKLGLAKLISEVIKELDKIQRLDDGSPTEIKEDRAFSIDELKSKLKQDPFFEETPHVENIATNPDDSSDPHLN